jgi:serine/threonine protein kinase
MSKTTTVTATEGIGGAIDAGTLLDGHLRVRRVLGRGGMGIVLEAVDERLHRSVAVKVMHAEDRAAPPTPELRARFAREARAVAALTSEHALRIYEVGELGDGTPFLVTELLDGDTLEALLQSDGPASLTNVVTWILEATRALAEAHSVGLIHRDLKPANIFLARRHGGTSIVKVIDFGLVKDATPAAETLTRTGEGFGTPSYMSPEQVIGSDVDARSDVWSLGVCLYELLTGELPFAAESVAKILWKVLNAPAPSVRSQRNDVPEAIDAIVARCLEKDRALRYANATELGAALLATGSTSPPANDSSSLAFADTRADMQPPPPPPPPLPLPLPPSPPPQPTAKRERREAAPDRSYLPFVFTTSVLAVLVIGMIVFLIVGMKARSPLLTAETITSSSSPRVEASTSAVAEVQPPTPTPTASESATGSAPTAVVSSPKKDPPLPRRASFSIALGAGSGEMPSPPPEIDRAIKRCGSVCPPKSRVRMRLSATDMAYGIWNTDEKDLCKEATNCVVHQSKEWRPVCPRQPAGTNCYRYVEIIF